MGLRYYSDKVNNSHEFPSNTDVPIYANISEASHKKHQYPIPQLSSETSSNLETYGNIHTYASVRNQDASVSSTSTSSCFQTNNYFNTSMLSSKPIRIPNETAYGKLLNVVSMTLASNSDTAIIAKTLDVNNNHGIYENIKFQSPLRISKSCSQQSSSSSAHTYINFEHRGDTPPVILTSPQKDEYHDSPMCPNVNKPTDIETNTTNSLTQIVKKLEVNMAPTCGDKSVLYRTKIPTPIVQIHPAFRWRGTLHRSKRHRRRSSTPFRTTGKSHGKRRRQQQQQHLHMNSPVHQSTHTKDQRKRSVKSVSNQLYNAVQQPLTYDNQSMNSVYSDEEVQVCNYPVQFHGALQHHIIAWYPAVTCNEDDLIPQVLSASENGESYHQEEKSNKEEKKEDEEFLPHDTFEDFLLRRPRKSSSSTSSSATSSNSSTDKPVRPPPLVRHSSGIALGLDKNDVDFIHDIIQRTHGDQRVSNRITALREAYVRAAVKRNDLLKTQTIDQTKRRKPQTGVKPSLITSKIRDELERYDVLPIHRRAAIHYNHSEDEDVYNDDDDDDDDDTYSINDDYRFHHRALPRTPSTAHRIINFMITVKRQLQKSFQEFRSRLLIETMTMPSNHISRHRHPFHDPSMSVRRHVARHRTSHDIVRHHHPTEHLHPLRQQHLYRTHSNTSHLHPDHRTSVEQYSPHRLQTPRSTPRQQRLPRRS